MFDFNISLLQALTFLVAVVSPVLVGLVTTRVTSSGRKAVLLAAVAAVTGFGSEIINALNTQTLYNLGDGLVAALTAFVIAVAFHYGLWKPTHVSDKALAVGSHQPH